MSTIKETTLHPDGNNGVDLYPKTNINQVQELPQKLTSVETQINQLNIDKLTKPTNPSAESAVTMLADGTVRTKPLSEIGGKLYRHKIILNRSNTDNIILNVYRLTTNHIPINSLSVYCNVMEALYISGSSEKYIGQVYFNDAEHINFNGTIIETKTDPPTWKTIRVVGIQLSVYETTYEQFYTVIEM